MSLNDTAHEIWAMAQGPQAIEDSAAAIEEKLRCVLEESQKLQDSRIKELEAEVAKLKTVPMKYRRMEFNAQLQNKCDELAAKLKALEAQEPIGYADVGDLREVGAGNSRYMHPENQGRMVALYAAPVVASQDAEDAARYRWLRHGDNDELIIRPNGWLGRNEDLDTAIDAAMKGEQK